MLEFLEVFESQFVEDACLLIRDRLWRREKVVAGAQQDLQHSAFRCSEGRKDKLPDQNFLRSFPAPCLTDDLL